jgi:hypothetical protein
MQEMHSPSPDISGTEAYRTRRTIGSGKLRSAARYPERAVFHSVFHTSMKLSRQFQPMINRDAV